MTTQEFNAIKDRIACLPTLELWAIVRSTNPLSERFAYALTYAKVELRRRGFNVR